MKNLISLKLGALLVLAPAGLLLSGCGGGNGGLLNHTGTTNPGTGTGSANFNRRTNQRRQLWRCLFRQHQRTGERRHFHVLQN